MKIYVINLQSRPDRRASVEKQLSGQQLDYSFFEAVKADDKPEQYFQNIDTWSFCLATGNPPSAPEIACYASHLCLWKLCVETDEPLVIFEDDFTITDSFSSAFSYAAEKISSHGFIRLEPTSTRFREKLKLAPATIEKAGKMQLIIERAASLRTTGYMITPTCAKAFIELSKSLKAPVDFFISWTFKHKQPIVAIEPPAIILSELATQSSIADSKNKTWTRHLLRPATTLLRRINQARMIRESEKALQRFLPAKSTT